jgi:hypothetical protein
MAGSRALGALFGLLLSRNGRMEGPVPTSTVRSLVASSGRISSRSSIFDLRTGEIRAAKS